MKNIFKLVLLILLGNTSHAQPLTIGDWQQLKIPASISGTAFIDEIYKGRIYAKYGVQYSSTNQGLSWEVYNNNPYYTNAGSIQKIGGRLVYFSSRSMLLKDYTTETWTDTIIPMRRANYTFDDGVKALLLQKDSVLAIGSRREGVGLDTLYMLKADTVTWKFKQISINVPHKLIGTIYDVKTKGDSIFMYYPVRNSNNTITLFTTMSSDGGRNWKTVCMGSEYSLTLQGNMLYTINRVAGDSLAVFRRNLPDTSITVLKAGMTKKSFSPFSADFFKLYTHENKVYINGLDGVYYLNGFVWQKIGIWPSTFPTSVFSLYFEGDTIWATTAKGLFRYTPQNIVWELRSNGLDNTKSMRLVSVKENKVLNELFYSQISQYTFSDNHGESPTVVLETDYAYFSSYSFSGSGKIVGYSKILRRSTNNGILWEESNTALPATRKVMAWSAKAITSFYPWEKTDAFIAATTTDKHG